MAIYPQHEKLQMVRQHSQTCGEFLEWLRGEGIVLAHYPNPESGQLWEYRESTDNLLARFFGIDLVALESEKRVILAGIRASHAKIGPGPGMES